LAIVDKLVEGGVNGISLLGGEPLAIGDEIFLVIDYAISKGIKISLVTNGTLLKNVVMEKIATSGIDQITISIDGPTKEIHESLRGKNTFEKVVDNVKRLTKYIKKNNIPIQTNINTVLNRVNYPKISKMIDLCVELEVKQWTLLSLGDIGFAEDNLNYLAITPEEEINAAKMVAQRYSLGNLNGLVVSPQFYPLIFDYIKKKYNLVMPKSRICCSASLSLGFISPDGIMYACDRVSSECYVGHQIDGATIQPMSLIDNSFYEIWNSGYYMNMFKLIWNEDTYKNYTPCNHCKYLKNRQCNPCPLYSLDSRADIKTCRIAEKALGDISGTEISFQEDLVAISSLVKGEPKKDQQLSKTAYSTPIKVEGLRSFDKGDFLILFNPYKAESICLNLIGKAIWDMIDGRNSVQEISDEIVNISYEIMGKVSLKEPKTEIENKLNRNVLSFFRELYNSGLISWISKNQSLLAEEIEST
jgi:MoaA/NifB/PqqE/SkfB family radical SAM enzyme